MTVVAVPVNETVDASPTSRGSVVPCRSMRRAKGKHGTVFSTWLASAALAASGLHCAPDRHFSERDASGGSGGSEPSSGGNGGSGGTVGAGGAHTGGNGVGGLGQGGSAGELPSGGSSGSEPTGGSGGAAGGGDIPCEGSVDDLRLWALHLGQSDYVALKNPSGCGINLAGLHLIFDDRDDAFPSGTELDCTVALPALELPPGASVRVHEDGLPGDIAALDDDVTVTACTSGVPFNPQRGGVTYLCEGPCAEQTVIDVVAHRGYQAAYGDPPALRFGVAFASPLSGVTDAGQNSMHYGRVATNGTKPNFTGSDWALERRTLYAGFEGGLEVELAGEAAQAWEQQPGQPAEIATSALTAAVGSVSLRIAHTGLDGVSTALRASLASSIGRPRAFSYFARVESSTVAAGFFDLLMSPFSAMQLSFKPEGLGAERENHQRTQTRFEPATWYQVEGRDIDYTARRFDLYVNRQLVAARVPFWTNAPLVDQLLLYSVSAGSIAYYDEIELWQ